MMIHFRIASKILCDWLWYEKDTSQKKEEIIMNKIRQEYKYSEEELQKIEKRMKQVFLPHFWKKCIKYRWTRDLIEQEANVFIRNQFIVKL